MRITKKWLREIQTVLLGRELPVRLLIYLCIVLLVIEVGGLPVMAVDDSATYQWTDDNGAITFSDNPMRIPAKHAKKYKKREAVTDEASYGQQSISDRPVMGTRSGLQEASPRQRSSVGETYGGHGEEWWRGQFAGTRMELEQLKNGLEAKRQHLKSLHYRKVVSNSSQTDGIFGNPRKNRENYRAAYQDFSDDEKRIAELELKLVDLEQEANRYGVPLAWRR